MYCIDYKQSTKRETCIRNEFDTVSAESEISDSGSCIVDLDGQEERCGFSGIARSRCMNKDQSRPTFMIAFPAAFIKVSPAAVLASLER